MRDINDVIDEAIQALADGDMRQGADQLYELALTWARAGMSQKSFEDIRGHIIQEAMVKTDQVFIEEKLKIIEREDRERRNKTQKNRKIITDNIRLH